MTISDAKKIISIQSNTHYKTKSEVEGNFF